MLLEARRLTDEQFRRAGASLGARCGLRFDTANRALLEEGLVRAADAIGSNAAALVDRLDDAAEPLLQTVLREVTIGETYFFRHGEHFEAVRHHALRERLRARGPAEPLRIWSAGCATGEEAWSLLIATHEAGRRVTVLGTDINKAALARARSGRYGALSVRGELPGGASLLRPQADGGVEVAPWLRAHARFEYLNLNDAIYPSLYTKTQAVDIIFCRNVLIYFAVPTATRVLARLADSLAEGGWLVVSPIDVELAPRHLERVAAAGVTLLRRPPGTSAATSSANAAATRAALGASLSLPRRERQVRLLATARAAANRGAISEAIELTRAAVAALRSADALHLLALLVAERGDEDERLALLEEVATRAPDDALALLALGLSERLGASERVAWLKRVLRLTQRHGDRPLSGPEPLPASWLHKVAASGLRQLRGEG